MGSLHGPHRLQRFNNNLQRIQNTSQFTIKWRSTTTTNIILIFKPLRIFIAMISFFPTFNIMPPSKQIFRKLQNHQEFERITIDICCKL